MHGGSKSAGVYFFAGPPPANAGVVAKLASHLWFVACVSCIQWCNDGYSLSGSAGNSTESVVTFRLTTPPTARLNHSNNALSSKFELQLT